MAPVRKEGSNEDIGHPRQIGRFRKYLMIVEDAVEQSRLGEKEQKGKEGKKDREMIKHRVEPIQDKPVKVIVLRMQGRRHGMQKKGEFEHQGICKQY